MQIEVTDGGGSQVTNTWVTVVKAGDGCDTCGWRHVVVMETRAAQAKGSGLTQAKLLS